MTKKQFYTAPTTEIFCLETEGIIATSYTDIPVHGGGESYDNEKEEGALGDAEMSLKKNPWQHTWE